MEEKEIGERVRAIREGQGIPQQHLAMTMTVLKGHRWHQTTVGKVESGERPIKLSEAVAVAEILGVPLVSLVGEVAPDADRGAAIRELLNVQRQIGARIEELRG